MGKLFKEKLPIYNKYIMGDTKNKCAKCFKGMDEVKYKTCEKCREYMRQDHQKNKERNNARRMEHYWNNREHAREYARKYKQEHREEINAKKREYRAKNYEQEYAKIKWMTCPVCNNYPIQSQNYKRHLTTALHRENLEKSESD